MKRRGEWLAAAAGPGAAALTASDSGARGRGSVLSTASANHACYWAGFGGKAGTPKLFPVLHPPCSCSVSLDVTCRRFFKT